MCVCVGWGGVEVVSPIWDSRLKEAYLIQVKDDVKMMDERRVGAPQREPHCPMEHGKAKAENRKSALVLSFVTLHHCLQH